MKRITRIKLSKHHVLGDSEFNLIDKGEHFSPNHFSLLIGQNGTGKSKLLEAISIILVYIDRKRSNPKQRPDFEFGFEIDFKTPKDIITVNQLADSNELLFTKDISVIDLLPDNLIVSAYTFNDKYPKYDDDYEFFKYCGLRTVTNNIFVNRPTEDCFNNLLEIIKDSEKLKAVTPIFEELGLNKTILIKYETGAQKSILESKLVLSLLKEIKESNEINDNEIVKFKKIITETSGIDKKNRRARFQDTSINRFLNNDESITTTLNYLSKNNILIQSKRSAKIEQEFKFHWSVDLSQDEINDNELFKEHLEVFKHLKEIEIVKFGNFQVNRIGYYNFDQASSGEFHFLHLTTSILRHLKTNSLVLIDEPEISLHPNWQNKLLYTLNPIFKLFPNSQFICASHSHLLVSSLEKNSSSIVTIKRDNEKLIITNLDKINTYGWSAEQILFDVFEMSTDRNYYLTLKVQKIIDLMTDIKPNIQEIEKHKNELRKLNFDNLEKDDPFNLMLKSLLK